MKPLQLEIFESHEKLLPWLNKNSYHGWIKRLILINLFFYSFIRSSSSPDIRSIWTQIPTVPRVPGWSGERVWIFIWWWVDSSLESLYLIAGRWTWYLLTHWKNIFAVFPPVKNKLLCKDLIYKGILNSSQDDLFFINSGLYRLAPGTKFPEQKEKINIILHYGVIS